jgi:hypothetical protein
VPLALTDLAIVLKAEGKLAGVIAAMLDPDVLNDADAFRTDVLAIVFPNAASQALRSVATQAGRATTRTVIRKYISRDILQSMIRFAGKYLGIKLTQRAIITKTLPLVGGLIGGGWNWMEIRLLGRRALKYYLSDQEGRPEPAA